MATRDVRVARRYAEALFHVALENDAVSAVEGDLDGIRNLLVNDPKFRDFLLSPHVAREEKLKIADKLFSDRVTALTMQAIRLLLEKRRESEIEGIREEYVILRRVHDNALYVLVTSAEMMPQDQRDALTAKLAKITGKKIETDFEIDGRLIGGAKVQFENTILDGSVRGSLNKLRDRLKYDLLKQV